MAEKETMSSSEGCPSIEPVTVAKDDQPADSKERRDSSSVEENTAVDNSSSCGYSSKMSNEETTTKSSSSSSCGSSMDYSTDGDTSPARMTQTGFVEEHLELVNYQRQCLQSTCTSQETNRVVDEVFDFCALDDSLPVSESMVQKVVADVEEEAEPLPTVGHRWQVAHSVNTYRIHQQQRRLSGVRSAISIRDAFKPIASSSPLTLFRQQRNLTNWQRASSTVIESRLAELQQAVDMLQHRIEQVTAALEFCRKKYAHRDSQQEINALRTLLLTSERRTVVKREMEQLKKEVRENQPTQVDLSPHGILAIKQISVKLNRKVANEDRDDSYYMIALVKYRDVVLSTSTAHQVQLGAVDCVKFFDRIELNNLSPNFTITVELHALCVPMKDGEVPVKSPCMSKGSTIRSKAIMLFSPNKLRRSLSVTKTTPEAVKFKRVGYLHLTHAMIVGGENCFYLDDNRFPLEGVIRFDMRCYAAGNVADMEHHGFLTMYESVNGHQSWSRYWCAISNGSLKFWKDPSDEEIEKDPIAIVDLSQCASNQMELVSKEECPRLHTLVIDVVHKCETSRVALKRFLLAADSKDDCLEWMRVTNEVLRNLRFWPFDSKRA